MICPLCKQTLWDDEQGLRRCDTKRCRRAGVEITYDPDAERERFILYDGRADGGDTSRAVVLTFDDTLFEARSSARDLGEAAIYRYRHIPNPDGSFDIVAEEFVELCRG